MSEPTVRVDRVRTISEALVASLGRLVPQLSSSAAVPDGAALSALLGDEDVRLFAAYDEKEPERVLGLATLVVFSTISGRRGWVEDVVVDEDARGRGVGQRLIEALLEEARLEACRTVDLTSRPSREAANRLYERCGFEPRATNVWRVALRSS